MYDPNDDTTKERNFLSLTFDKSFHHSVNILRSSKEIAIYFLPLQVAAGSSEFNIRNSKIRKLENFQI